ncbi:MAG: hypothetical protein Kilf2KO_11570 [Rhodospirillales bacterium]
MRIAIPRERQAGEPRVAASAETVKRFTALGADVVVESGAGQDSAVRDSVFEEAGATIVADAATALKGADIVLKVQRPLAEELSLFAPGTVLAAILDPYRSGDDMKALAASGVTAFAMDLMPRITRAQSMDVLSSQANLAGYKAVLDACEHYAGCFPMMTTAAGTIHPAKVLVMGAGVAGLQAIATARRLGAIVMATDVRPAAKEQVMSLGAKFVAVEDEEFKQAESAGGYAKEMSAAYQKKQAALIAETIAKMDIVITTAQIPGRAAPRLVSAEMVASMKPGSILVDLAVETGGNVEGARPGEVVDRDGVKIVGHRNVPGRLAAVASQLYARNLFNFLSLFIDKEKGLQIDWEDQVVTGTLVTKEGAVAHEGVATAIGAEAPKAEPEAPAEASAEDDAAAPAEASAPADPPAMAPPSDEASTPDKTPAPDETPTHEEEPRVSASAAAPSLSAAAVATASAVRPAQSGGAPANDGSLAAAAVATAAAVGGVAGRSDTATNEAATDETAGESAEPNMAVASASDRLVDDSDESQLVEIHVEAEGGDTLSAERGREQIALDDDSGPADGETKKETQA